MARWILNTIGLWLSIKLFGTGYAAAPTSIMVFVIAGLIFSIVNAMLKPVLILLALPALMITLGLFMFVVNGVLVYISLKLSPDITITFWHAILTGAVISLVNYIVSNIIDITPQTEGASR